VAAPAVNGYDAAMSGGEIDPRASTEAGPAPERTVRDDAPEHPTVLKDAAATPGGRTPGGRTPGRGGSSGTWAEAGAAVDFEGGRFGRYQLEGELGRGGMGVVYKARHVDLNRRVALKVMLAGAFADEAERKRFLREAEAAALLSHPHIVGVHDFAEIEGNAYFTMDFVEGKSLAELIPKGGLPQADVVRLMGKIAEAVGYAHLRGIIHRDLKPANVMIDAQGEPRLLDFGLAKRIGVAAQSPEGAEKSLGRTVEGALLGTPYYMAPEQASGSIAEIDTRSDVWALGVMLFELLSGERPFTGGTVHDILMKIISDDPPSLRSRRRGVDIELEAIVARCLEREKNRRYATGRDLAEDLARHARGDPVSARRVSPIYRLGKKIRRHKAISAVVTAAVLAVSSLVAWQRIESGLEAEGKIAEGRRHLAAGALEEARDAFQEALVLRRAHPDATQGQIDALARIQSRESDLARERREAASKAEGEAALRAREEERASAERERLRRAEALVAEADTQITAAEASLGRPRAARAEPASATASATAAASGAALDDAAQERLRDALLKAERAMGGAIALAPEHARARVGRFDALALLAELELRSGHLGAAKVMAGYARATHAATATADALDRRIRAAEAAASGFEGLLRDAKAKLADERYDQARTTLAQAEAQVRALGIDDRGEVLALQKRLTYLEARREGRQALESDRAADAIRRFRAARLEASPGAEADELDRLIAEAAGVEIGRLLEQASALAAARDGARAIAAAEEALELNRSAARGLDPRPTQALALLQGRVATPDGFAFVAGGRFRAGSEEASDRNPARDAVVKAPLYLGLREVSALEYADFVAAGGYASAALEALWDPAARPLRARFTDRRGRPGPSAWIDGKPAPDLASRAGQDLMALPVTGISWYEARAFAAWRKMRLPSEDEWERAALEEEEGRRRAFPWGDAFDAGVGGFPARGFVEVGRLVRDRSAAGCFLMGGNVHEWCVAADGGAVLRGGGARLPYASEARGARRFVPPGPAFRGIGTGLRLAVDALR